MTKPSLPQGTRDFNAETVRKRNFIFNTIRSVFEVYGFQPLETPAMENLDTLMGKYGDEGDKLIFRILESGNPFSQHFFKELGIYFKNRSDLFENVIKNDFPNSNNDFRNPLWELNPELLSQIASDLLKSKSLNLLKNNVSRKALRYDLTIPFARMLP